jgi:hypothetical protein
VLVIVVDIRLRKFFRNFGMEKEQERAAARFQRPAAARYQRPPPISFALYLLARRSNTIAMPCPTPMHIVASA